VGTSERTSPGTSSRRSAIVGQIGWDSCLNQFPRPKCGAAAAPVSLAIGEVDPGDVVDVDHRGPQIQQDIVGVAVRTDVLAQHFSRRA
jgi:hypothetical protein